MPAIENNISMALGYLHAASLKVLNKFYIWLTSIRNPALRLTNQELFDLSNEVLDKNNYNYKQTFHFI